MRTSIYALVAATGLAIAAAASAQSSQTTPGQQMRGAMMQGMGPGMMRGSGMMMQMPMTQGMGSGQMMGMGPMMHGAGQFVEGRIAFLKAELRVTGQQEQAWNRYAEAMRGSASAMKSMHEQMMSGDGMTTSLPDRLRRHEQMMSMRLQALKDFRAAALPLYEALSPKQQRIADNLMGMM
ncbi:MAG: Spy/CpxP family protein refolding chaperone [Alphaproteobacteria bacterium]